MITAAQAKAARMKRKIEKLAVKYKLNLTIHEGKIGFVDQEHQKIVMTWAPNYTMKGLEKAPSPYKGDENECLR